MDLLQILIEMIIKAASGPKKPAQARNNSDEVVRQIQARIEAARVQVGRAQSSTGSVAGSRTGFHQNKGQLAPQLRQATPLFKQRKPKRKMPPALPAVAAPQPAAKLVPPRPAVAAAPAKPAAVYVDAKVLTRWLVPQTLRSQFILTEVFQPPVSLRESHLS